MIFTGLVTLLSCGNKDTKETAKTEEVQKEEEAKQYRRGLNLHRGAYHPGYFIEKQDDNPVPSYAWPERS